MEGARAAPRATTLTAPSSRRCRGPAWRRPRPRSRAPGERANRVARVAHEILDPARARASRPSSWTRSVRRSEGLRLVPSASLAERPRVRSISFASSSSGRPSPPPSLASRDPSAEERRRDVACQRRRILSPLMPRASSRGMELCSTHSSNSFARFAFSSAEYLLPAGESAVDFARQPSARPPAAANIRGSSMRSRAG